MLSRMAADRLEHNRDCLPQANWIEEAAHDDNSAISPISNYPCFKASMIVHTVFCVILLRGTYQDPLSYQAASVPQKRLRLEAGATLHHSVCHPTTRPRKPTAWCKTRVDDVRLRTMEDMSGRDYVGPINVPQGTKDLVVPQKSSRTSNIFADKNSLVLSPCSRVENRSTISCEALSRRSSQVYSIPAIPSHNRVGYLNIGVWPTRQYIFC